MTNVTKEYDLQRQLEQRDKRIEELEKSFAELREEFPLLDTPENYHESYCCEWSINHDRKRLHKILES